MKNFFYQLPVDEDITFAHVNHSVRRQARDALHAEMVGVSKLRAVLHGRAEGTVTTTSSGTQHASWVEVRALPSPEITQVGPIIIGSVPPLIEHTHISEDWENWNADKWVAPDAQAINPLCLSLHESQIPKGWHEEMNALITDRIYECRKTLAEHIFITIDTTISEFTQPQRDLSVLELIAHIRDNLELRFSGKLSSRLELLRESSIEEYPDQEPISPNSLKDLIAFIGSLSNVNYPSVVLTYEGNIRAEWTASRNKHFAVEFMGNNDLRFVVFSPDKLEPYKTNRQSGTSTISGIYEQMTPFGVFDWVQFPDEEAA